MLSLIAALAMATTMGGPSDEFRYCMNVYDGMEPVQVCENAATVQACASPDLSTGYIRFSTPIYGDVQYFPVTNFHMEGFDVVADIAWDFGDLIFKQGDAEWDSCE